MDAFRDYLRVRKAGIDYFVFLLATIGQSLKSLGEYDIDRFDLNTPQSMGSNVEVV